MSDPYQIEALTLRGDILLRDMEEPAAAMEDIDRLVGLEPEYGYGRLIRGLALLNMGRCHEALEECERASMLMPRDPRPWGIAAQAHLTLGDKDAARKAMIRMNSRRGGRSSTEN